MSVERRHLQAIADLLANTSFFVRQHVEVLEPLPGTFALHKVRTDNPGMGFPDEVTREPIGGCLSYSDTYDILVRAVQNL